MTGISKKLMLEIASIVLVAAAAGGVWNSALLYNAWTGKSAAVAPASGKAVPGAGMPLPAGLMQVKDFFDYKEAVFVDARDSATFAQGHIKGAISLPVGELEKKFAAFRTAVPADALLVVYCNGYDCHDSMELGKKLMASGYRNVFVFEGGFPEWKDAGYPVEQGKS